MKPRSTVRLRDLWALPFAVVRVPLWAVDRAIVQRLDRRSGTRFAFDCGVGTVDLFAGHLLEDDSITRYGIGRVQAARASAPQASMVPRITALHRTASSQVEHIGS